jgi:PIN domain nuclease of toxin-antitoxin system
MSRGYLLDTQVLVWLTLDQKQLGREAKRLLERYEVFFCTPSVAELSFKQSIGKLKLAPGVIDSWIETGVELVNFDRGAAEAFGRFSADSVPDPFDRQIMSVAATNNLTLITADQKILSLGLNWVLDATT